MKKKLSFLLMALMCIALMVSGCGQKQSEAPEGNDAPAVEDQQKYTIRVGLVLDSSHPHYIALDTVFKKEIEEKSNGRITVEIYPNSQLGSDRQTVEALTLGTLEMSAPSASILAGFNEEFMVLDLPYLFKSTKAARDALDGDLGELLNQRLDEMGIVNLAYGESGFRNTTNNVRPIYSPEDFKGIKLRCMENPLHIATFKAYGANPTPMAFGELFTALQQKTVDGQDNATIIVYTSKFYEVQKYLSVTEHIFGANCYLVSKKFLESLPSDLQEIVRQAAKDALVVHRQLVDQQQGEYAQLVQDEGMEVNTLTAEQKDVFAKASESVYVDFIAKHGSELVDAALKYN